MKKVLLMTLVSISMSSVFGMTFKSSGTLSTPCDAFSCSTAIEKTLKEELKQSAQSFCDSISIGKFGERVADIKKLEIDFIGMEYMPVTETAYIIEADCK
jgi:hypothetical protein